MGASRPTPRRRWQSPRPRTAPGRPRRAAIVVLGMGNPLLGDDGVGWAIASRLAHHPGLPADVYVTWGGTDLIATSSLLDGRTRAVLIDAVEGEVPGRLVRLDPWASDPATATSALSPLTLPAALRVLRMLSPELTEVDVRLLGVTVGRVRPGADLSPTLAARLPALAETILSELA